MVAPSHPMPRQRVYFGPYLLLQTLGEGEFGKVKLGVHSSPDRWGEEVAIKLIKRGNVDTQARMIKVAREIDVLKLVKHPNIVRLYDVIETEKYIGIVLEYASGGELFDHILAHRYLKEKDASKLFAQLISGVTYLHAKKIVHRDLKLENLLLDRNRNIIITDFGFANRFEDRTNDLMATSCGSPCYAAPELVVQDGRYVGSQVDVWSCGVILYAMLAGYLPFDDDPSNPDGDNINLLYKYIINTPLSFPDWITDEPKDLLLKMLVPDPLKRCSLNDVANHSWLSKYHHLFTRSLEELERLSEENEQAKRLILQRQRQLMAANNANRSQPSLAPDGTRIHGTGNASAAANKARGHQSAMVVPSSAMVSPDDSLHTSQAIGAYQQQQRQVPGGVVTYLQSNTNPSSLAAPVPSNRRHQQAQSAVVVPVSSLNKENDDITATQPQIHNNDNMVLDEDHQTASTGKKRKVGSTTPSSPAIPPGTTPSHSQQRYTVQVEYTGVAKGKGRDVESWTTSPTHQKTTTPHDDDDGDETSTPRLATPAAAPLSSSKPKSSESHTQSTPQPGRTSKTSLLKAELGSPSTPKAIDSTLIVSDELPTPTVPFPSPPRKHNQAPESGAPPKSSSQVSFSTSSQNSAAVAPNGTPKPPTAKAQSRHRKGLSTDRFFSRLLGANVTQPSNPPPPVPTNTKKSSGYSTTTPPVAAKTARRKALSMVVEPLSGKLASAASGRSNHRKSSKVTSHSSNTADAQKPDQSKRRTRGTSVAVPTSPLPSANGSMPPLPISSSDKSHAATAKRRTTLTASHGRNSSNKMSTSASAPQALDPQNPVSPSHPPRSPSAETSPHREEDTGAPTVPSPNRSQHTPAASVATSTGQASNNSKAKRVMDWFRFKSLNGSTTSANQAHAHAHEHLVPPVPIPTDFDARVKNPQPTPPALSPLPNNASSPPTESHQPALQVPVPLMSKPSATQTSAASSKTSHRFTLAHPRPSTSTAVEFRNPHNMNPAAEQTGGFNDSKLKLHHGAIDQNAISSKLPPVIMQQLKQILWEMGIDVVEESSMKLKATRRSKKKVVASLGMGVFEALQQQQQKLNQQEPSTGAFKSIFNRRVQTASNTNQQIGVLIDQFGHVTTGPSTNLGGSVGAAGSVGGSLGSASGADHAGSSTINAQPLPSYADDPSVDSGDDVRFTVEITRLRGLVGLYAVDIKRLKGSLWSFKYLYLQILERADLGQKP
ncbi:CAMK/CAMKL/KIN4 protein kinase [Puccinia sorghi]|uniref:non-specific serine/threonine protein kinase n=1 Tax=Puccinia sorghi TaxID=27349 RepID=A0A0L6UXX2_9BASI|nr:CAMK/CAMKL/KIN4 protein kinase [Puccinia sorghi]